MGQDATLEILAEILLDVRGNRGTRLIRLSAAGQPDFQMALHYLIYRAALGPSPPINRCIRLGLRRYCLAPWDGYWLTNRSNPEKHQDDLSNLLASRAAGGCRRLVFLEGYDRNVASAISGVSRHREVRRLAFS